MTEKVSEDFIKRLNVYKPVRVEPLPEGMGPPFADTTPFDAATDDEPGSDHDEG